MMYDVCRRWLTRKEGNLLTCGNSFVVCSCSTCFRRGGLLLFGFMYRLNTKENMPNPRTKNEFLLGCEIWFSRQVTFVFS